MKFNTKTRYGVRTMLEIALHESEGGMYQKDIAKNQELSLRYLDHIIASLKTAGLITTVKGKKSGYILTRKPEEISIYDIHRAFEPGINVVDCMDVSQTCEKEPYCAPRFFWDELNFIVKDYLNRTTLADIVAKHHELN